MKDYRGLEGVTGWIIVTSVIYVTCTPVLDQPDEGILPGSRLDCEPCGDMAILRGWRGN